MRRGAASVGRRLLGRLGAGVLAALAPGSERGARACIALLVCLSFAATAVAAAPTGTPSGSSMGPGGGKASPAPPEPAAVNDYCRDALTNFAKDRTALAAASVRKVEALLANEAPRWQGALKKALADAGQELGRLAARLGAGKDVDVEEVYHAVGRADWALANEAYFLAQTKARGSGPKGAPSREYGKMLAAAADYTLLAMSWSRAPLTLTEQGNVGKARDLGRKIASGGTASAAQRSTAEAHVTKALAKLQGYLKVGPALPAKTGGTPGGAAPVVTTRPPGQGGSAGGDTGGRKSRISR